MAGPGGRGILDAAALLVGAGLAALALIGLARGPETDFEDFALGEQTLAHYARVGPHPIHCRGIDDAADCIEGHRERGDLPVVLWLGNSQLHGINQWKPGDASAPELLFPIERARGRDVVAFSQPNANMQEHLVLFTWLARRLPVERLILPVVFDDFRESDIREIIVGGLADADVAETLRRFEVGRTLLENHGQQLGGDLAALANTIQQRSETALDHWFEEHSRLWAARPQARGQLVTTLYQLRNTVFGISAQSKRRVIPGRLRLNLAATGAILEEARRLGVEALVYVVPLRSDVDPPYVASEYEDFKKSVAAIAREHRAGFANLEDLVPARYWGEADAGRLGDDAAVDFMHFQSPGHALLAEAMSGLLAEGGEVAGP